MKKKVKKPQLYLRSGRLQVSVWENYCRKNSKEKVFRNITFSKSYMDKSGNWNHSKNLSVKDIPLMIVLLQTVYSRIIIDNF